MLIVFLEFFFDLSCFFNREYIIDKYLYFIFFNFKMVYGGLLIIVGSRFGLDGIFRELFGEKSKFSFFYLGLKSYWI